MSDILSTEEISALLSAYRAAEHQGAKKRDKSTDQQVRPYDFARPDKFSRENLRTLHSIHKKYANDFAISLTSILHMPVQTDLLSVDQVAYWEYLASVPENTLFCDVNLEPLSSTTIFEFNPSIASSCIDGLTGGSGIAVSHEFDLTDIDKAIMSRLVGLLLKRYEEAWKPYISINASVHEADTRGSFQQLFIPTEPVLVCVYELHISQCVGLMSICIPAGAVEAILPSLSAGRVFNTLARPSPAAANALQHNLQEVEMECSAILGRTTLTMGDVMNLHEGDIIRLESKPSSEIEFWVGDTQTYFAVPGKSGRKLGVRVTRTVNND